MQQTQKYKLNLIEPDDPFLPDALNANTQKMEDAMTAHEAAVKAKTDALDAAVIQLKAENLIVKLAGPVVAPVGASELEVDISGIDLSRYSMLYITAYYPSAGGSPKMGLNGLTKMTIAGFDSCLSCIIMRPIGPNVSGRVVMYSYTGGANLTHAVGWQNCPWSSFKLQFTTPTTGGLTVNVYGFKG